MFNEIVSDTLRYLEPFNFVDLCKIKLLKIELFYYLCLQNLFTNHIFNIYVKTGFGMK